MAMARVSCVWRVHSTPGKRGDKRSRISVTWRGLAIPVVSASAMPAAPMSDEATAPPTRGAPPARRPRTGSRTTVEMPQYTATFARAATWDGAPSFTSDSATVMLTLARLWLSLAETTVWIASTPASTARTAPLSFGTSAT